MLWNIEAEISWAFKFIWNIQNKFSKGFSNAELFRSRWFIQKSSKNWMDEHKMKSKALVWHLMKYTRGRFIRKAEISVKIVVIVLKLWKKRPNIKVQNVIVVLLQIFLVNWCNFRSFVSIWSQWQMNSMWI